MSLIDCSTRCIRLLACLLIALHVGLALWAASGKSATVDEPLHLVGGYFINRYGDYRIQPENGNLPQRLAGLPASLLVEIPTALQHDPAWRMSDSRTITRQFFYESGIDHWPLLMSGRCLMMVFSVGTCLLIFWWANRLFGQVGALFSLALYALDPNVLAHAPLATSDSAAVFFLLAGVTAFWRSLESPNWRNAALSAVTFGFACVAKFSTIVLVPVCLLVATWLMARTSHSDRAPLLRWVIKLVTAHAVGAWIVIWIFFGCRFSGFSPTLPPSDRYMMPWDTVDILLGWQGPAVSFLHKWRVFPEAFLYGYTWVVISAQQRAAFLAGAYSTTGWIEFFPLAFWWKSTLALLGALATGALLGARHIKNAQVVLQGATRIAPLVTLFLVYGILSLTSRLNIGHRHILPLYPVLYILCGALAGPLLLPGRWRTACVTLVVAGQALANARVAPHYLAFFNSLAGGPTNGWRLLVDSSSDWGQDLPALRTWLKANQHPDEPLYFSYFGPGRPDLYGIQAIRLPDMSIFDPTFAWHPCGPGLYAVSATMLQHVYLPLNGAWSPETELEYRGLQANETSFKAIKTDPDKQHHLLQDIDISLEQWNRAWKRYAQLRFARLCHYLRAQTPDALIGYSILIYRLDQTEIDQALGGAPGGMLAPAVRDGNNPPSPSASGR